MPQSGQQNLLHLLRQVAFADNAETYQAKLDALVSSDVYGNYDPQVQKYLKTKWLQCTTVSVYYTVVRSIL